MYQTTPEKESNQSYVILFTENNLNTAWIDFFCFGLQDLIGSVEFAFLLTPYVWSKYVLSSLESQVEQYFNVVTLVLIEMQLLAIVVM